jgi:hypothetical protein
MPDAPIDPSRVAVEHRKMRQPVKSIATKRTPLWLKVHQAEYGLGYRPTWATKG